MLNKQKDKNTTKDIYDAAIIWFRNDLRLHDNLALNAAVDSGLPIVALYILDPSLPIGGAAKWWLHYSLEHLQKKLTEKDVALLIYQGNTEEILSTLCNDLNVKAIFWNDRCDQNGRDIDTKIKDHFSKKDINCCSYNSNLLFEPWSIKTKQNKVFKIFSPFWKRCLSSPQLAKPVILSNSINVYSIQGTAVSSLKLLPTFPDWSEGLTQKWNPGEDHALNRFYEFLEEGADRYKNDRDYPGIKGTSTLSPHLVWGEISPRLIYHHVMEKMIDNPPSSQSLQAFLRQLGWREFSYYLLYHFPGFCSQPLKEKFLNFPWNNDEVLWKSWTKGQTGYPIVDAGMRQLWKTGSIHNRVRLIVASFLTKHLLISWQQGADWFLDTLVDADIAINSTNWQWVAGCGTDASPYFRIFNPSLQSKKFDASGDYIYKWVPELKKLPAKYIHSPWLAPENILAKAKIQIGRSYPSPIVDHNAARYQALEIFRALSKKNSSAEKHNHSYKNDNLIKD